MSNPPVSAAPAAEQRFVPRKITTKLIIYIGVLIAAEVVLNRFLSVNAWNLKIGFSFIPIALAAILFGPLWGGVVGALGDFLGAILFPIGPYFPGFTFTQFLVGMILGLFLYKKRSVLRTLFPVLINNLILSLLLNSVWISVLYGAGFIPLLATRIIQCAILLPVQFVVILIMNGLLKTSIPKIRASVFGEAMFAGNAAGNTAASVTAAANEAPFIMPGAASGASCAVNPAEFYASNEAVDTAAAPEVHHMTGQEAIQYIEAFTWSTTKLGLDRTRELLAGLGNPQKQLKFIHVAGSNGKGSTCAMLDRILREAGYRVGLYTSPYIEDFNERIRVNGINIPNDRLAEVTEKVRVIADRMEDHPSQFELVTAVGIQYFLEEHCDIVVLEVGMGGELDSTNAIDAPEVAVITNIGLEHTEYLGNTLGEIASAKAGIIKTGCSCVCYGNDAEVTDVVAATCERLGVPLVITDHDAVEVLETGLNGQRIRRNGKEYELALLGPHQARNAGVALEVVDALRERGWHISEDAVSQGLAKVSWAARFEILNDHPLFILDGGHNPQCAEILADSLKTLLPDEDRTDDDLPKAVVLIGVLADKDYKDMIAPILPYAKEFVCLTPFSGRALPAEDLAAYLREQGAKATVFSRPSDAEKAAGASGNLSPVYGEHDESAEDTEVLHRALKFALDEAGEDGAVVSYGSLYLAGHVRAAWKAMKNAAAV